MPQLVLSIDEVRFLLRFVNHGVEPISPLSGYERPGELEDYESLLAVGAIIDEPGGIRLNLQLAAALHVVADPEEVIDLTFIGDTQTGFTVCRRGQSYVQYTMAPDGKATIAFPVNRGAILEAVAYAFSGSRETPEPLGVWFSCFASTAFVLGSLIRHFGAGETNEKAAGAAVIDDLNSRPEIVLPFLLSAGKEAAFQLRDDATVLAAEIAALEAQGIVHRNGENLNVTAEVAELLGAPVEGSALLQRVSMSNGEAHSTSLQVLRLGERLVIIHPRPASEGQVIQHWEEVDRDTLRLAAVSLFLEPSEIEALSDGAESASPAGE